MVAEDEEGCFEEYKKTNLVASSVNVICQSLNHNEMSPAAVSQTVHRWYRPDEGCRATRGCYQQSFGYQGGGMQGESQYNITLIPAGTIVQTLATRCDNTIECWDAKDEKGCSQNAFDSFVIGKYLLGLLKVGHYYLRFTGCCNDDMIQIPYFL